MASWSGLGWTKGHPYGGYSYFLSTAQFTEIPKYVGKFGDAFPRMRMIVDISTGGGGFTYPNNSSQCLHLWADALKAHNAALYILYGTTNNRTLITGSPQLSSFIPSAYATYSTYMLAEAAWAQAHSMDAFCMGNENLIGAAHDVNSPNNVGMTPTSLTRASNIVTAVFSFAHGLTNGDYIIVGGGTDSSFRVADNESAETVQATVVNSTTFTYSSSGSNGVAAGTYKVNWSAYEVVRKTKALAALCQAVFTRGPIVYSESQGHVTAWINLGFTPGTDIDLWGYNGYGPANSNDDVNYLAWKVELDSCFAAFSTTMIVTEFNVMNDATAVSFNGVNYTMNGYERVRNREVMRRLHYMINLGITQVYFYETVGGSLFYNSWYSSTFDNAYLVGDFRPLYNILRNERIQYAFFGTGVL